MNGMGGEAIDALGTIDPANLSNSGTLNRLPLRYPPPSRFRVPILLPSRDFYLSRKSRSPTRSRSFLCGFASISCARIFPSSPPCLLLLVSLSPAFKLIPPLVSVLPAPSPAEPSPRGIKRSRTPDHSGNGHTEGDQDDGTCVMGWECVVMLSSQRPSCPHLSVACHVLLFDRIWFYVVWMGWTNPFLSFP